MLVVGVTMAATKFGKVHQMATLEGSVQLPKRRRKTAKVGVSPAKDGKNAGKNGRKTAKVVVTVVNN